MVRHPLTVAGLIVGHRLGQFYFQSRRVVAADGLGTTVSRYLQQSHASNRLRGFRADDTHVCGVARHLHIHVEGDDQFVNKMELLVEVPDSSSPSTSLSSIPASLSSSSLS